MTGFLVRLAIAAVGLWAASRLVPGVVIDSDATLLLAALLLGVVNATIRPLVVVLTFPITVVTLGFFLWVVNAGMFALVAALLEDFRVAGFGSALLGALVVSMTSWVGSWWIAPSGRVEVLEVRSEVR